MSWDTPKDYKTPSLEDRPAGVRMCV